ncbi:MAG: DegV family protein [Chloroflexi bacterium]|nr:DegV family protein [Chloroflexota bacterium]
MTVKVVTDSTSDIPPNLAQDLNITVVPIYVIFGQKVYRDRVDIFEDEFYHKLGFGSVYPTTSVPSPQDFADAYNKLAQETDEIISIHITSKLSGTYNSALLGTQLVNKKCRIEVVDSMSMSMGLGLSVIAAAREALAGSNLEQVTALVRQTILQVHTLILADTLKYAVRGGRVSKTYGLLGTVLRVRALLGMRDGDLFLAGLARTRAKALERMYEFAKSFPKVQEIALAYTTEYNDVKTLAERLKPVFPETTIYIARVGPAIGTYGGPGGMGIGVREQETDR